MKTIKEWLQELPEPYRTQALANTPDKNLGEPTSSFAKALSLAFIWRTTKEGAMYWEDVSLNILPPRTPKCALQAIHAIAVKKDISVEEIISITQVVHDTWDYWLKESAHPLRIVFKPE